MLVVSFWRGFEWIEGPVLISGLRGVIPQFFGFSHLRIKARIFARSWPRLNNAAFNPLLAAVLGSTALTALPRCPFRISATSCCFAHQPAHSLKSDGYVTDATEPLHANRLSC